MNIFSKSVPYIEAFQQTECGLSCICMILRFYNCHHSLMDLREYLEVGRDGSTLKQLNKLAQKFNLKTNIYKCKSTALHKIQLPAILYCGDNHFVILEKINKKNAFIIDPTFGKYRLNMEELDDFFSELVLCCTPDKNFVTKKQSYETWKYFIAILIEKKKLFRNIVILSMITYLLTLGLPIFIQNLIDNIKTIKDINNITNYYILLVIFSIIYIIFYYLKGANLVNLKVYVDNELSTRLFTNLLNVPYKYFDVRNKYDLIYSLNSSMILRETFANQIIKGLIDLGAICFIIIYMLYQSILLACIAIVLFIINLVIIFSVQKYVTEYNKYLIAKQGEVQGVQVEAIFSILSIKMSGNESFILSSWYKKYNTYIKKYLSKEKISNFMDTIMSFIHVISPLIVLSVSTYLVVRRQITTGQMIAFFSLSTTFFSLANSIFSTWVNFINSSLFLDRISDIVLSHKDNEEQGSLNTLIKGNITLDNICFSYTKLSNKVIRNISLKINSGDKVAIVGKSGCGKSTLAKLIVGLYKPVEGDIYYDDIPINQFDTKKLRSQIGIVPQDVMLFNKSILDNITMNRDDITFEQVEKACSIAQIAEDIHNLPMGYHTIVSEMGMNFSGGQRQRIALARAILDEPKILILDEATSSLDNVNEKAVTDYLKAIGCTRIIIAHRLSTVIDSDIIFVMDNGELVETGTHEELIRNDMEYARLFNICLEDY